MKSPLFQSVSGYSRLVAAIFLVVGVVCGQKYDQTNLVSNVMLQVRRRGCGVEDPKHA